MQVHRLERFQLHTRCKSRVWGLFSSQVHTDDESYGQEPEQQQHDREAALHGRRGSMPWQALSHEQAAEQLLSADAMRAACPHLESAKCARVEVALSDLRRATLS